MPTNAKQLTGTEIITDGPLETSTATAIERPSDGVQVIWRWWDAGFERSYHGTPGIVDLGDLSAESVDV